MEDGGRGGEGGGGGGGMEKMSEFDGLQSKCE